MLWIPRSLSVLVAVLAASLPAGAAHIITYSSIASFESAAGEPSVVIDDYSDWVGPGPEAPGPRPGYSVAGIAGETLSLVGPSSFPDGALQFNDTQGGFPGIPGYLFTFDQPISGLGFDFDINTILFGCVEIRAEVDSMFSSFERICKEDPPGFWGTVFDAPQTEVTLFVNGMGWQNLPLAIDDLRVVPEAGPMVTLVAGVACAALLGARRRKP